MLSYRIKAFEFNRKAMALKSKPDLIIKALSLSPGDIAADLGVGGGYFAFRFLKEVGKEGRVYAIDKSSGFLKLIKEKANRKKAENIIPVHASIAELEIENDSLDLIFLRNVYHHLHERSKYFEQWRAKLKDKGRVAIVEYNGEGPFWSKRKKGHNVKKEIIIEEMEKAGFKLQEDHNFLAGQSFTVYGKMT